MVYRVSKTLNSRLKTATALIEEVANHSREREDAIEGAKEFIKELFRHLEVIGVCPTSTIPALYAELFSTGKDTQPTSTAITPEPAQDKGLGLGEESNQQTVITSEPAQAKDLGLEEEPVNAITVQDLVAVAPESTVGTTEPASSKDSTLRQPQNVITTPDKVVPEIDEEVQTNIEAFSPAAPLTSRREVEVNALLAEEGVIIGPTHGEKLQQILHEVAADKFDTSYEVPQPYLLMDHSGVKRPNPAVEPSAPIGETTQAEETHPKEKELNILDVQEALIQAPPPPVGSESGDQFNRFARCLGALEGVLAKGYIKDDLVRPLMAYRKITQEANPGVNVNKLRLLSLQEVGDIASNTTKYLKKCITDANNDPK